MVPLLAALGGLVVGAAVMYVVRGSIAAQNAQSAESRARRVVLEAEREAETVVKRSLQEVKDEIAGYAREAEADVGSRREELTRQERRMAQAEEEVRAKMAEAERPEPTSTIATRSSTTCASSSSAPPSCTQPSSSASPR